MFQFKCSTHNQSYLGTWEDMTSDWRPTHTEYEGKTGLVLQIELIDTAYKITTLSVEIISNCKHFSKELKDF